MKKLLFALLLSALLSAATSVYANDTDGLWISDEPLTENTTWLMTRGHEDSTVLFTTLTMNNFIAWAGPYDKTTSTARLHQLNHQTVVYDNEAPILPEVSQLTLTFTSQTRVTIELTECRDFPGQNNCGPIGTAITATKFY